ncbi:hypothetical protein [Streptomyces atratus]|uniref:hypothetical protein n=1 Tax=Streptomyces atratus TaxID=1893 RepID=UPI0021A60EAF|nr:hypothetical protein [Streptomyces atratus]MCT2546892.1 hypothetical protein [Streptomyces atratus]
MAAHPNGEYAITAMYPVPDDAWYLELDLVRNQRTLVTAVVPDQDPAREPTVCFHGRHLDIPYEVMRWFKMSTFRKSWRRCVTPPPGRMSLPFLRLPSGNPDGSTNGPSTHGPYESPSMT